jgi:predicted nicotinamide N-methyase
MEETERDRGRDGTDDVDSEAPERTRNVPVAANSRPVERRVATLRRRARQFYALRDVELALGAAGRRYQVALPANPDAPLDEFAARADARRRQMHSADSSSTARNMGMMALRAAAAEARRALASGEHMPYWGLLWPSGLALAEEIVTSLPGPVSDQRREKRRALELGCGLGVTATAALDAGMALWAADCFPEAVAFCRYNALRNTGRLPRTAVLDWRTEAGQAACRALGRFDTLLAADVLYEEQDITPLLELAPRVLAPGGTFWLAEPGRRVARMFVEMARVWGWRDDERVYECAWPPDDDVVRVVVHRFTGLAREDERVYEISDTSANAKRTEAHTGKAGNRDQPRTSLPLSEQGDERHRQPGI